MLDPHVSRRGQEALHDGQPVVAGVGTQVTRCHAGCQVDDSVGIDQEMT